MDAGRLSVLTFVWTFDVWTAERRRGNRTTCLCYSHLGFVFGWFGRGYVYLLFDRVASR